jgi:hypothetical protein
MKLNRFSLTSIFLLLLLLAIQSTAVAQTKLSNCEEIKKTEDFLALADRRAELLAESQQLKTDISALESQLPGAMTEADMEKLKKQLADLEAKPPATRTPLEAQTMENLESKVKLKTDQAINNELGENKRLLAADKDLLSCIQEAISQLSSPDQAFRKYMSLAFAALIGAVIIGFFILAGIDETMRRAIFSGETGIQFLTLFSLVIAIILFGITNILQDKELAALLGGLSGYILGRTGTKNGTASQSASTGGVAAFRKFIKALNSINVVPPSANLSDTSKSQQLVAEPKDINGAVIKDDDKTFVPEWESSDPGVAKVDQAGLVSKVGPGTANVTASFGNVVSSPCVVTCT